MNLTNSQTKKLSELLTGFSTGLLELFGTEEEAKQVEAPKVVDHGAVYNFIVEKAKDLPIKSKEQALGRIRKRLATFGIEEWPDIAKYSILDMMCFWKVNNELMTVMFEEYRNQKGSYSLAGQFAAPCMAVGHTQEELEKFTAEHQAKIDLLASHEETGRNEIYLAILMLRGALNCFLTDAGTISLRKKLGCTC